MPPTLFRALCRLAPPAGVSPFLATSRRPVPGAGLSHPAVPSSRPVAPRCAL
ncbi:hypothetical protein DENSPDRAFT_846445 [Dentipellis sp. KUC8613]|nr:hypothetical protein DENSPDRAFT_846445 [Dentipellis sp. KUC8613]